MTHCACSRRNELTKVVPHFHSGLQALVFHELLYLGRAVAKEGREGSGPWELRYLGAFIPALQILNLVAANVNEIRGVKNDIEFLQQLSEHVIHRAWCKSSSSSRSSSG